MNEVGDNEFMPCDSVKVIKLENKYREINEVRLTKPGDSVALGVPDYNWICEALQQLLTVLFQEVLIACHNNS